MIPLTFTPGAVSNNASCVLLSVAQHQPLVASRDGSVQSECGHYMSMHIETLTPVRGHTWNLKDHI